MEVLERVWSIIMEIGENAGYYTGSLNVKIMWLSVKLWIIWY